MTPQTELWAASPWSQALDGLRSGQAVVLVDDTAADLVFPAATADAATLAVAVRVTSGLVTVALPDADCDRLRLPEMHPFRERRDALRYTVSVDAAAGVSTGISARDRAHTVRLLADPSTPPDALTRPGHVLVLRTHDGGVLKHAHRAEAAVELVRAAGHPPASASAQILSSDGGIATGGEAVAFAARHRLPLIRVEDVVRACRAGRQLSVAARLGAIPA